MAMVAVMGIEKHAAFYRAYQPADRSPLPVAMVLATLVALWLLVYLISAVGPGPGPQQATVRSANSPHPAYALSPSAHR